MATRRTRGPYSKTALRQENILAAAMEYFGEFGFWGSSMRDIAAYVGISRPGLQHHFPTKLDLLTAVLEERDRLTDASLNEHILRRGARLDAISSIVETNLQQPEIVRLFTTLSAEATSERHPAHDYFRDRYVRTSGQIAMLLQEAAGDGEIGPQDDYDVAARVTLAAMYGLQVQWLLDPTIDMVQLFERYLAAYFRHPLGAITRAPRRSARGPAVVP